MAKEARIKGQMQMSFGVIFSIILIIVIVVVATYVTINFLNLGKCAELGIFYDSLNDEVNKAWRSSLYQDVFEADLPGSVSSVCFGNLREYSGGFEKEYDIMSSYRNQDKNLFFYPMQECKGTEALKLDHVTINGFFCVPILDGKLSIALEKDQFDELVSLRG